MFFSKPVYHWADFNMLALAKTVLLRAFGCWSKDQHRRLLSWLLNLKTYQHRRKKLLRNVLASQTHVSATGTKSLAFNFISKIIHFATGR